MGTQQPLVVEVSVTVVSTRELRAGILKQVKSKEGQDATICQCGDRREQCPKRSMQQDPRQPLDKVCKHIQKWNKVPGENQVTHRAGGQARARVKQRKMTLHLEFPPGKCCVTHMLQKLQGIVKTRGSLLFTLLTPISGTGQEQNTRKATSMLKRRYPCPRAFHPGASQLTSSLSQGVSPAN